MSAGTIVDAFAAWDDPDGYRVFLVRELDGKRDDGTPMENEMLGDSVEVRLYRAAFVNCFKDLADKPVDERVLTFEKEAAAKRVAKVVRSELKRIAKGEPAMTLQDFANGIAFAKLLMPKKRRRP